MTIGPRKKEIDVLIQDSTSPFVQYFLMNELKTDIALTAPVAIGDEVVNVSAGHGFTGATGEHIVMFENNRVLQLAVKSVATNAITIAEPSTVVYTVAEAAIVRGNILMNVKGDVTPVEFKMEFRNFDIPIDFSQAIMTMQHGTNVPDDGKFGGLAALAKGVYYHKEDGAVFSLGNYTNNQDFKDIGATIEYTDKAPAGTNGTNVTINLKEVFGQVMRIDPDISDIVKGVVRDDIGTVAGMAKFTTSLIGSYTSGE